jgi:transcriptional adapter 2-alpha
MQKAEKNKSKEEKDLIQRYKVFAKAQTAEDFEVLLNGLHCASHPLLAGIPS